jgi:hypothetical protein
MGEEKKFIVEINTSRGRQSKWEPKTIIELLEYVILELENKDVDWNYSGSYVKNVKITEEKNYD